jgi:hypothetical protein
MATELCQLAQKYGADKCPEILHSYTPDYHLLLQAQRNSLQTVLEIGIGNIPLMGPVVGTSYMPGASLRMWRDYFPNAEIIGADIDRSILFNEHRISSFYLDQSNEESLNELVKTLHSEKNIDSLDLIIDDGSHEEPHMVLSFKQLWSSVRPHGGLYIIEDIWSHLLERFINLPAELGLTDIDSVTVHPGRHSFDGFVAYRKS